MENERLLLLLHDTRKSVSQLTFAVEMTALANLEKMEPGEQSSYTDDMYPARVDATYCLNCLLKEA